MKMAFLGITVLMSVHASAGSISNLVKNSHCEVQLIRINDRLKDPTELITALKSKGYLIDLNQVNIDQPESSMYPELFVGQTYDLYNVEDSAEGALQLNLIAYNPEDTKVGNIGMDFFTSIRGLALINVGNGTVSEEYSTVSWGSFNTSAKREKAILGLTSFLPECISTK